MKTITYKQAGVDIEKADQLIEDIRGIVDATRVKGSMDSIGGFGGLFDPSKYNLKDPILVASTDGVGTKLKIAQLANKHDTIGTDLVAMCVNDCLCTGARPIFFLDYFAQGKLKSETWTKVLKSIVRACRESGCALLGGETAEMPGMYRKGEYDLAGFAVGIVERKKIIDGKRIRPGDVLLGIASTGLHSNGFSFVRKIFTRKELKKRYKLFLRPTQIYVRPFLELMQSVAIKGAAHITGGGFYDNMPRMLPKGVGIIIKKNSWVIPKVFKLICDKVQITERELYRTFNMGIGMALALSLGDAKKAQAILDKRFKLKSWVIGEIVKGRQVVEIK